LKLISELISSARGSRRGPELLDICVQLAVAAGATLAGTGDAADLRDCLQLQARDRIDNRRLGHLQTTANDAAWTLRARFGEARAVHRQDSSNGSLGGMIMRLHLNSFYRRSAPGQADLRDFTALALVGQVVSSIAGARIWLDNPHNRHSITGIASASAPPARNQAMFAHPFSTPAALRVTALAIGVFAACVVLVGSAQEPKGTQPVQVKIKDEKPVIVDVESSAPIDPTQHVQLVNQGNMMVAVRVDNQTLHLGAIQTLFKVDNQIMYPGNPPGRMTVQNQPLGKGKGNKLRIGSRSVYEVGKLTITQEVEVIPTRAKPGQKRRLDSALVHYIVENKDDKPHSIGARIFMDVFIVNNDGALFAAPTEPGKVLDGVELKGKKLPDYVQFLQMPNLQNPGFVAHMTLNFGRAYETPDRVVLTSLGAQIDQWNVGVQQAGGDSAMAVFWEPKEIKAGTKKNIAYAYGQGIAPSPEPEGAFTLALGGSFEPGKLFSVAAVVNDAAPGQTLALEMPPGLERVEGKERQPVPANSEDGNSMVLWKGRVLQPGEFTIRVRSSTGLTHGKILTISRP
jgi:hypothetical protein